MKLHTGHPVLMYSSQSWPTPNLCPEVAVQMLVHGEGEMFGVVEGRGGRVGDDLRVMVREGVELVHHVGAWRVGYMHVV